MAAILLSAIMPTCAYAEPDSAPADFEIYFLNVGQSDAAFVVCDGHTMMIDGGNAESSDKIYNYISKVLKPDSIACMVSTAPQGDSVNGLIAALKACKVENVYMPCLPDATPEGADSAAASFQKRLDANALIPIVPETGDSFKLGDAEVTFTHVQADDESVLAVRIVYGSTSFLFTGNASCDGEAALLAADSPLNSTLLRAGRHGSDTANSAEFLKAVAPEYIIISAAEDMPSDKALKRMDAEGAEVYRTDINGDIICRSNGRSLTLISEVKGGTLREDESAAFAYVGNGKSMKFHLADCPSVDKIKDVNRVNLSTREEAIEKGFKPCKRCKP